MRIGERQDDPVGRGDPEGGMWAVNDRPRAGKHEQQIKDDAEAIDALDRGGWKCFSQRRASQKESAKKIGKARQPA